MNYTNFNAHTDALEQANKEFPTLLSITDFEQRRLGLDKLCSHLNDKNDQTELKLNFMWILE